MLWLPSISIAGDMRMTVCNTCGQPGGDSPFCVNCGANLSTQLSSRAIQPSNPITQPASPSAQPVSPGFQPPSAGMPSPSFAGQQTKSPARSVDRRVLAAIVAVLVIAVLTVAALVFLKPVTSGGEPTTPSIPLPAPSSTSEQLAPISTVTVVTTTVSSAALSIPTGTPGTVSATALSSTSTADDSVDDMGNRISYAAARAVDGDVTTAWRAATGNGVGQELVLRLPGRFLLTSVGLIPGYDKVDAKSGIDRFQQNRRIARVSWSFDDKVQVPQDFQDNRSMQTTAVNVVATTVRIRVESSRAPANSTEPRDFIAISEVSFQGLPM
jgi:hypothetical protein